MLTFVLLDCIATLRLCGGLVHITQDPAHPEWLAEDMAIFNVKLSDDEIFALDALTLGEGCKHTVRLRFQLLKLLRGTLVRLQTTFFSHVERDLFPFEITCVCILHTFPNTKY